MIDNLDPNVVWRTRLGSKNEIEREAAIQELAALGDAGLPIVSAVLPIGGRFCASRSQAQLSAVQALGRIGSVNAVEMLLQIDAKERKRRGQLRNGIIGLMIVFVAVMLVTVFVDRHGSGVGSMGSMFGVLGAGAATGALRKGAVDALATLREPKAAGSLAIAYQESGLSKTVEPVLIDILPQVREEHVAAFSKEELVAIVRLLRSKNSAIVAGALHVVGLFGGEEALEVVDDLDAPELADKIEACRSKIKGRLAARKDQAELLRASSAETADATSLLRPAGHGDLDAEQLLRESRN